MRANACANPVTTALMPQIIHTLLAITIFAKRGDYSPKLYYLGALHHRCYHADPSPACTHSTLSTHCLTVRSSARLGEWDVDSAHIPWHPSSLAVEHYSMVFLQCASVSTTPCECFGRSAVAYGYGGYSRLRSRIQMPLSRVVSLASTILRTASLLLVYRPMVTLNIVSSRTTWAVYPRSASSLQRLSAFSLCPKLPATR